MSFIDIINMVGINVVLCNFVMRLCKCYLLVLFGVMGYFFYVVFFNFIIYFLRCVCIYICIIKIFNCNMVMNCIEKIMI